MKKENLRLIIITVILVVITLAVCLGICLYFKRSEVTKTNNVNTAKPSIQENKMSNKEFEQNVIQVTPLPENVKTPNYQAPSAPPTP